MRQRRLRQLLLGGALAASSPKKPYQPPKLSKVKLRPEEAVLGACKATSSGPGNNPCDLPSPCFTFAS